MQWNEDFARFSILRGQLGGPVSTTKNGSASYKSRFWLSHGACVFRRDQIYVFMLHAFSSSSSSSSKRHVAKGNNRPIQRNAHFHHQNVVLSFLCHPRAAWSDEREPTHITYALQETMRLTFFGGRKSARGRGTLDRARIVVVVACSLLSCHLL